MKHERKEPPKPAVEPKKETVRMRRDQKEGYIWMDVAKADVESHLRMGWRIVVGED